jgi:hypothetical protein
MPLVDQAVNNAAITNTLVAHKRLTINKLESNVVISGEVVSDVVIIGLQPNSAFVTPPLLGDGTEENPLRIGTGAVMYEALGQNNMNDDATSGAVWAIQAMQPDVNADTVRWITLNPLSRVEMFIRKGGGQPAGQLHFVVMNPDVTPPTTGAPYPGTFTTADLDPDPTNGFMTYTFDEILPAGSVIGITFFSTSSNTVQIRVFARGVIAV